MLPKVPKPHVFNKLRIQPTLLVTEKYERKTGMYLTDVWDDIRELTSGYFAGHEPFRKIEDTSHFQNIAKKHVKVNAIQEIILHQM